MKQNTIHYPHPTGFAFGLTVGIVYIVCGIFVKLLPNVALTFFNDWFHGIDLTPLFTQRSLTLLVFLRGFVEVVIAAYIFGFIFALIYNKCVDHCMKNGW